jgi:hypothetical protein
MGTNAVRTKERDTLTRTKRSAISFFMEVESDKS